MVIKQVRSHMVIKQVRSHQVIKRIGQVTQGHKTKSETAHSFDLESQVMVGHKIENKFKVCAAVGKMVEQSQTPMKIHFHMCIKPVLLCTAFFLKFPVMLCTAFFLNNNIFISPNGKLKLSFDRTAKKISQ